MTCRPIVLSLTVLLASLCPLHLPAHEVDAPAPVDHSQMDHSQMDHATMDHSQMDHAKMGHGRAASPVAMDHASHAMPAAKGHAPSDQGTGYALAPDGSLWRATKATLTDGDHVVMARSTDLGVTWSENQVVNPQAEKVAADGESRPIPLFARDGSLLVVWSHPLGKPYTGEIRLARRAPGAAIFAAPVTVHQDRQEITHRFESIAEDALGRIYVAWIDKRDLELAKVQQRAYAGASIWYAVSKDAGRSFAAETRLAEHVCECCRLALAQDGQGRVQAVWRAVFGTDLRDHAAATLSADGAAGDVQRVTFDNWHVDACPHQGPALAFDGAGLRHLVWYSERDGAGRMMYARQAVAGKPESVNERVFPAGAGHAALDVQGDEVWVAWRSFSDGQQRVWLSHTRDGVHWADQEVASTAGASDYPRLQRTAEGLFLFWRRGAEPAFSQRVS